MPNSFEERVIVKTNDLIAKFSGNLKRFQNNYTYNNWFNEGLIKNEFQVGKVGENYEAIYLVRTSKAALRKNKPKVLEFNQLLRKKKNGTPTIDELANLIGFIVSRDKPKEKEVKNPTGGKNFQPPVKVETKKTFTNRGQEDDTEDDLEDNPNNQDNPETPSLPVVDSWEDL